MYIMKITKRVSDLNGEAVVYSAQTDFEPIEFMFRQELYQSLNEIDIFFNKVNISKNIRKLLELKVLLEDFLYLNLSQLEDAKLKDLEEINILTTSDNLDELSKINYSDNERNLVFLENDLKKLNQKINKYKQE